MSNIMVTFPIPGEIIHAVQYVRGKVPTKQSILNYMHSYGTIITLLHFDKIDPFNCASLQDELNGVSHISEKPYK